MFRLSHTVEKEHCSASEHFSNKPFYHRNISNEETAILVNLTAMAAVEPAIYAIALPAIYVIILKSDGTI